MSRQVSDNSSSAYICVQALAQRDELEEREKRAYRLTAFTLDPNLL